MTLVKGLLDSPDQVREKTGEIMIVLRGPVQTADELHELTGRVLELCNQFTLTIPLRLEVLDSCMAPEEKKTE